LIYHLIPSFIGLQTWTITDFSRWWGEQVYWKPFVLLINFMTCSTVTSPILSRFLRSISVLASCWICPRNKHSIAFFLISLNKIGSIYQRTIYFVHNQVLFVQNNSIWPSKTLLLFDLHPNINYMGRYQIFNRLRGYQISLTYLIRSPISKWFQWNSFFIFHFYISWKTFIIIHQFIKNFYFFCFVWFQYNSRCPIFWQLAFCAYWTSG